MINRVKVGPFERPNKIDNPENANQERYKLLLLRKTVVQWWGVILPRQETQALSLACAPRLQSLQSRACEQRSEKPRHYNTE